MSCSRFALHTGLVLLLAITPACAAFSSHGTDTGPPLVAKVDQLAGVWITYQASARDPAARETAIAQALTVLGMDLAAVENVVPSATGVLLAQQLAASHDELLPYTDLIARLYTLAVYGLPAEPAKEPQASPPAAASPAMTGGRGIPATGDLPPPLVARPARAARRRRRKGYPTW